MWVSLNHWPFPLPLSPTGVQGPGPELPPSPPVPEVTTPEPGIYHGTCEYLSWGGLRWKECLQGPGVGVGSCVPWTVGWVEQAQKPAGAPLQGLAGPHTLRQSGLFQFALPDGSVFAFYMQMHHVLGCIRIPGVQDEKGFKLCLQTPH